MKPEKRILICGASVAGPALAYWLQKYGYSVLVVERAQRFRDGGQNVDIKGAGQQVIKQMGIDAKIESMNTQEQGQRYVDDLGNTVARFPKGAAGSLTSTYEILRGDLAQILYDATKDTCEYRFGTFLTALKESDSGVSVTFNDGSSEEFALVACAEGFASSTRKIVMHEKIHLEYMGAYMSFLRIPKEPEDDLWAATYHGKGGVMINLRPGHENTTVLVTFLRDDRGFQEDDPSARKQLLREVLTGAGGVAERVLANLDYENDLYLGPMSQVKASSWSKGRVALLGDAACCPTPFTGRGTTLALVGAYVLAGEIKKHKNHVDALRAYENTARPYIESGQQLSPRLVRLAHPKTKMGISLLRLVAKVGASEVAQKLMRPRERGRVKAVAEDFVLPTYL